MKRDNWISKPNIPRLESRVKVTGSGLYTDDLTERDLAYGAILRSPYARAEVEELDPAPALLEQLD